MKVSICLTVVAFFYTLSGVFSQSIASYESIDNLTRRRPGNYREASKYQRKGLIVAHRTSEAILYRIPGPREWEDISFEETVIFLNSFANWAVSQSKAHAAQRDPKMGYMMDYIENLFKSFNMFYKRSKQYRPILNSFEEAVSASFYTLSVYTKLEKNHWMSIEKKRGTPEEGNYRDVGEFVQEIQRLERAVNAVIVLLRNVVRPAFLTVDELAYNAISMFRSYAVLRERGKITRELRDSIVRVDDKLSKCHMFIRSAIDHGKGYDIRRLLSLEVFHSMFEAYVTSSRKKNS